MDGHIFKGYRGGIHDNPQISNQGTPGQDQVTRCRVEDTPINAVSNQVVVGRFWIYVCGLSKRIFLIWHKSHF